MLVCSMLIVQYPVSEVLTTRLMHIVGEYAEGPGACGWAPGIGFTSAWAAWHA
jgi:hypothetical protein